MEFATNFFGAGDQGGGIAGAAGGFGERNLPAGDAACGGDDFADAETGAVAEIVDTLTRVFKSTKDEEVGLGEVVDVDIVTDTSAVRSGIVGAKNANWTGRTKSGAEQVGDEMGLGVVAFGVAIPRAGGVEITEDGVAESVNLAKPLEHDFGLQFGLAVGIHGEFGSVFADGNGLRKTEDGAGGGEDKTRDFVAKTGFEKCERGSGIVAEIKGGVLHGLGDFGECGEVHNGVDGRFGKELVEEGAVGDIADHQAGGGRYRRAVAAGEVIENGDLKIALQEEANGGPANVASAASDEDVLGHVVRTNYAPVQTKALPLVLFF